MRFGLSDLLGVMRPKTDGAERKSKAISTSGIDALIHALQVKSWKTAAIDDRLLDTKFPYSGHFDPPKEIEDLVALSLMFAGNAVGRPIVRRELLTTPYQEKLSPPFIYAAWYRLQEVASFPAKVILGKSVFLATAPTGKIYPVTYSERQSKTYAMVFDANLLLFYRIFLTSIASICFSKKADDEWGDSSGIKWGRNFRMDKSLDDILRHDDDSTNIASLLLNIVVQSLPFSEAFGRIQPNIKQQLLLAALIDDLYVYLLAHEIGHIALGHFDETKQREEPTLKGEAVAAEEREADIYAFALLANTISLESGNFRLYIHASVVFHVMSFLYRAVNLLRFRRDYGHLPPLVLRDMYFPPEDYYPHPLARLFLLRREVRDKATILPEAIDHWDSIIDAFFENLWKPVCLKLASAPQQVSAVWRDIIDLHMRAYTAHDG